MSVISSSPSKSLAGLRIDLDALGRLSPVEQDAVREELRWLEEAAKDNPLHVYRPHAKQQSFHSPPFPPGRLFLGGNRSGKTTATMVDTIIQAVDHSAVPEHLRLFKRWEPPFFGRVITPDLTNTLEGVVLQKFREWCPRGQFKGGGFDRAWDKQLRMLHFKNGSWIQFFSNDQDLDKFGGAALHRVVYDEEPRADIRRECLMRLIDYGGEELYGMTPLHGMCVDVETECLTRRGWKRHDEIIAEDVVLTYNIERGMTEWAPLLAIYRDESYDGPMLRTPGHLDSVFTPDHKWVTERGLVAHRDLKKTDRAIVARPHLNLNEELVGIDFWELVGWFLAEGSVVKGENKMVIYQSLSRYPEHCRRIELLLRRLDAQFHVADRPYAQDGPSALHTVAGTIRRFVVTGDIARQLRWVVGHPKRLRPEIVGALDSESLHSLLAGLLGGDGHVRPSGKWEFTSCDWQLADAVSMVGVLLGFRTNIRRYNSPSSQERGDRPVYRVTGSNRESITEFKRRAVPVDAPKGGVWCPCTPNKTWVARRGGTAFITGNSWVYDEFFEPWERGALDDVRIVVVDMDDNPHLDRVTMQRVLSGLSAEERQARKSGRFVAFSGLIYKEFSPKHVIPELERLPEGVEAFRAIDPGIRHMCAVLYAYLDQSNDLVVFDEIAMQGATIKQVCEEMERRDLRWGTKQPDGTVVPLRVAWTVIDPAARNKNNQTGRSDQSEFLEHGVVTIPAQNSVTAGINRVKERLEAGKLKVCANCVTLRGEFKKYRWTRDSSRSEADPRETPVKRDDHCIDSLRYLSMQRPLVQDRDRARPSDTMKDRLLRYALKRLSTARPVEHFSGPGLFS